MYAWKGLMLPDGDVAIRHAMEHEGKPEFEGKPTYQFRKWFAAKHYLTSFRHGVDVGAHIGLWSRVMCRTFDRITAFEPIEEYRQCFKHNVQATNVTLHPYALGNEAKVVELEMKAKNSGVTHIVDKANARTRTAEMHRLDSFELQDVDFLKIDCEGYEWFVIKGAEKTILRCKPVIIVEQKESTKDRYGLPFEQAVRLLKSWGAEQEFEIGGDHCLRWK